MRRTGNKKHANPELEAQLLSAQREATRKQIEAHRALRHRDRVAWKLFHDHGYLQREIADIVNMEADPPITEDAFQKAFARMREGVIDLPVRAG